MVLILNHLSRISQCKCINMLFISTILNRIDKLCGLCDKKKSPMVGGFNFFLKFINKHNHIHQLEKNDIQ